MALVTLSTLRTRVKQRADQEHGGSEFVTDDEINQLINTSYAELYGELVRAGIHVAESTEDITATGAALYALPTDFYSVIGVYHVESGYHRRLARHSTRKRVGTAEVGTAVSYRINNGQLELYPRPSSGTYQLVYIPQPLEMDDDDDTMDGVLGWEEYVVVTAAIQILIKEESDTDPLERQQARLLKRILEEASAAEATESWVVENVRTVPPSEDARPYRGIRGLR